MSDSSDIDDERASRVVEEIGADDYYVGWVRAEEIVLKLISTIRLEERASHERVVAYVDELAGGLSAEAEAKLRALLRGAHWKRELRSGLSKAMSNEFRAPEITEADANMASLLVDPRPSAQEIAWALADSRERGFAIAMGVIALGQWGKRRGLDPKPCTSFTSAPYGHCPYGARQCGVHLRRDCHCKAGQGRKVGYWEHDTTCPSWQRV